MRPLLLLLAAAAACAAAVDEPRVRKQAANLSLAMIHAAGHPIRALAASEEIGWYIDFGCATRADGELTVKDPSIAVVGNARTTAAGAIIQLMSAGFTRFERTPDGIVADIDMTILNTAPDGQATVDHHRLHVAVSKASADARPIVRILAR